CLQRLVPGQSPLFAVEGGRGREAGAGGSPGAAGHTGVFDVEHDFASHVPNGQVADDTTPVVAQPFNPLALEEEHRIFLDVEEISRAQVVVAIRLARIDARRVNAYRDLALLGILRIKIDGAVELIELPTHRADHHVAHSELNVAVGLVNLPTHLSLTPFSPRNKWTLVRLCDRLNITDSSPFVKGVLESCTKGQGSEAQTQLEEVLYRRQ